MKGILFPTWEGTERGRMLMYRNVDHHGILAVFSKEQACFLKYICMCGYHTPGQNVVLGSSTWVFYFHILHNYCDNILEYILVKY